MNAHRGFTLLELLVALVLVGLIAALSLDGLRTAARTWDGIGKRSGTSLDLRLAEVFLRDRLEQAQPAQFSGERDALRFVAPLPAHLGAGGMQRFALALAEGTQGRELVVVYALYQDAAWTALAPAPQASAVLVRGLQRLELEYFGAPAAGLPPAWSGQWEEASGLPQLLRIRMQLAGARAESRELLVAPRLTTAPPPR